MIIVITGTPGVGKTSLAKVLAKKLKCKRLDLSYHYKRISTRFNTKKQCYDIDMKKFEKLVKEKGKKEKNLIIDSHIANLLPKKMIDLCIVLTCSDLKMLEKRLKRKKYSKKKVRENLDAEIFQVCLLEAKEKGHKVVVVDTTKKISQKGIVKMVKRLQG